MFKNITTVFDIALATNDWDMMKNLQAIKQEDYSIEPELIGNFVDDNNQELTVYWNLIDSYYELRGPDSIWIKQVHLDPDTMGINIIKNESYSTISTFTKQMFRRIWANHRDNSLFML